MVGDRGGHGTSRGLTRTRDIHPISRMNGSTVSPRPSPLLDTDPGLLLDHLSTLGDETRVRLLLVLDRSEFAVGELCRILQLPQSTVSRHLKLLSDAGWVQARTEGTSRPYRFTPPAEKGPRGLWRVVREGMLAAGPVQEDAERAGVVLAERRERSRSFFRSASGQWDALRTELFGAHTERLGLFGLLDPAWTVGDLGCGTGALSATVAPSVARVIAVDREPGMLESAAPRMAEHPNVELRRGELEALPVEEGELDLAFCALVLHLVPDPRKVMAEAARGLRRGGLLVVVDMRAHDREEYREEMGHLWTGFSRETMEGWLEDAGFDGVRVRNLPPDPAAKGPLLFAARGRRV